MLETYSDINKIAAQKIVQKYKKYFPNDINIKQVESVLKNFDDIIKFEDEFRNAILTFYANNFFRGDINSAKRELERRYDKNDHKFKLIAFVLIEIIIFLILGFVLLVMLAGKYILIYTNKDNRHRVWEIHIYFPAFSFTLMVNLFLIYVPILIFILKKYRINYLYLLEIDPQYIHTPATFLIVSIAYRVYNTSIF
jgi:hypothetical protein